MSDNRFEHVLAVARQLRLGMVDTFAQARMAAALGVSVVGPLTAAEKEVLARAVSVLIHKGLPFTAGQVAMRANLSLDKVMRYFETHEPASPLYQKGR